MSDADYTFTVTAHDNNDGATARAGEMRIGAKSMHTPAFMPVGTLATVKSLSIDDLTAVGAECILGNTYHLHLRPGEDVVEHMGGLHAFMGGWPGIIITDSGGYQVFSLAHRRSLNEDGVTFRAHTDGSLHAFTPESVVEIQRNLGSDIHMALDECPPPDTSHADAGRSLELTARWAERARRRHADGPGIQFGICQGGMHEDLRIRSAHQLAELDFPGYGIGGLGIGEPKNILHAMIPASLSALPTDKPRYLMGIGAPDDMVRAVLAGVDMFDCVLQTREARNGALLTHDGRVNINNAQFVRSDAPIEAGCDCPTCAVYSRAYLHHLFRNRELLGYRLTTLHNVRWTVRLMENLRAAIVAGKSSEFASEFLDRYKPPSRQARDSQRQTRVAKCAPEDVGEAG